LPFPEISYAEDLYWAKSARTSGLKINIFFRQGVFHQNIDSLRQSFKRGKLEAKGHFEGHLFSGFTPVKLNFMSEALSITILSVKLISKIRFIAFFQDFRLVLNMILQRYGFILKWNNLVISER